MESENKIKSFLEFIKEPLLAVFAALLITQFLFMHSVVPSESMESTMNVGEHFIINRIPYYYRDPVKGEIVIFENENQKLVKRVIGEPGDVVDLKNGKVFVNGELLDESAYVRPDNTTEVPYESILEYPYTVPEDTYFLLGDNRGRSRDGRYFGPIERKKIIATQPFRIYPFNKMGIVK
ncbi:MAG: signal peptidase I [Cellulosilyticaceae bacterium]